MRRRSLVAWATAVALTSVVLPTHADDKSQCVDANTQGQNLRRDGKLAAARAQLRTCAAATCPGLVRNDCTQRLDELERAQPTIVFEAKDAHGGDLVDVRVSLDGQLLTAHLDGTASMVDPGTHELTFEAPGQPPVTRKLLVNEGEKGRREQVILGGPGATPAAGTPTAPSTTAPAELPVTPPSQASSGLGTQRILGIAVGGAGIVGLGLGAVFGVMASSAWSSAKNACGGSTSQCADPASATSYRNTTLTDGTLSTVAFIAGGVLLAGGAVLFLTGGHGETGTGVALAPSVGPGQGGIAVLGAF
ncbi:MAG TPA: hypothetical protein VIJ22_17190 [Polyangiaceae bacterium]